MDSNINFKINVSIPPRRTLFVCFNQRTHESDEVSSQLLVIAAYAHARTCVCSLRIRDFGVRNAAKYV